MNLVLCHGWCVVHVGAHRCRLVPCSIKCFIWTVLQLVSYECLLIGWLIMRLINIWVHASDKRNVLGFRVTWNGIMLNMVCCTYAFRLWLCLRTDSILTWKLGVRGSFYRAMHIDWSKICNYITTSWTPSFLRRLEWALRMRLYRTGINA